MAWPKVWPRFRMARRPDSRSSCHHLRLQLAGAADGVGHGVRIQRAQLGRVQFTPGPEFRVQDQAVLDHLGQTGRHFARRQRVQHVGIDLDRHRLVERADHVLAQRVVDGGLAAHRGIDLRQQRRRHLQEAHAAHVDGGGEAGHVADHPPPSATSTQRRSSRCDSSASKIRLSDCQSRTRRRAARSAARACRCAPAPPRRGRHTAPPRSGW